MANEQGRNPQQEDPQNRTDHPDEPVKNQGNNPNDPENRKKNPEQDINRPDREGSENIEKRRAS